MYNSHFRTVRSNERICTLSKVSAIIPRRSHSPRPSFQGQIFCTILVPNKLEHTYKWAEQRYVLTSLTRKKFSKPKYS